MIGEFTIPLIVVVGYLAFFQLLFGVLGLDPGFATFKFVRISLGVGIVPGVKELTRVASLRFAIWRARFESFAER